MKGSEILGAVFVVGRTVLFNKGPGEYGKSDLEIKHHCVSQIIRFGFFFLNFLKVYIF